MPKENEDFTENAGWIDCWEKRYPSLQEELFSDKNFWQIIT